MDGLLIWSKKVKIVNSLWKCLPFRKLLVQKTGWTSPDISNNRNLVFVQLCYTQVLLKSQVELEEIGGTTAVKRLQT